MLKVNYQFSFIFSLFFPLISIGQTALIDGNSLQSTIISNITISLEAQPIAGSISTFQSNKLTANITPGIGQTEKGREHLKNNKNTFPKNTISLKIGADDPWFGITYERLLSQYFGAEAQIGLIGASVGAKLYYPGIGNGRVNLYVGVMEGWGFGGRKTYFPIGMSSMKKNNFRLSFDAGPRIWHGEGEENFLGFSFKIGKAF